MRVNETAGADRWSSRNGTRQVRKIWTGDSGGALDGLDTRLDNRSPRDYFMRGRPIAVAADGGIGGLNVELRRAQGRFLPTIGWP